MTKLIGLTGRKFAGKDTFARLLIEDGERTGIKVVRVAFADKLKLSFARCFFPDISEQEAIEWCDTLKEGGQIVVSLWDDAWLSRRISGREALQNYGTEAHRDVFGPDFWVDALLPNGVTWGSRFPDADVVVVADCRFVSEAERIKAFGGRILELERELPDDGDQHASEAGLPRDYIYAEVPNNGTVDDLKKEAVAWLARVMGWPQ